MLRIFLAWLSAVIVTGVSGSLIQSHRALGWIAELDGPIQWPQRLSVYRHDLIHFWPLWTAIIALGFLIAFLVAGGLSGRWPIYRRFLFPVAGATAVVTALLVMDAMLPVTVIAAARDASGVTRLALAGALGGWVYVLLRPQRQNGQN
jgi:hypothetical protein